MATFNRRHVLSLLGGGAVLVATGVSAHDGHDHGDATPGASPAPEQGTGTGAVYMNLRNTGDVPDRLVAVSTPRAREVQIHEMSMAGEVMQMQELPDGLIIEPGADVRLEPSGYHLMLVDLTEDTLPGSSFDIDVTFEVAGSGTLTVPVLTDAPEEEAPVVMGSMEISGVWSRPAPRLSPVASPIATPAG